MEFVKESDPDWQKAFSNYPPYYSTKPHSYFMSEIYKGKLDKYESFQARLQDTYVATFPKTGTTWLQEIVYLIMTDLDFETEKTSLLSERFPYLDFEQWIDCDKVGIPNPFTAVCKAESPRFIKTHLPYELLPPSVIENNCKIICAGRNPKDTVISYYYMLSALKDASYRIDMEKEEFIKFFMQDKVPYASFWNHQLSYWKRRNTDNVTFVFYEDMKRDLPSVVKYLAERLGKKLTDSQVGMIVEHCSFHNMKDNKAVNNEDWMDQDWNTDISRFMRKGQVGDWKNHMNREFWEKFDEWIEEKSAGHDLTFTYE